MKKVVLLLGILMTMPLLAQDSGTTSYYHSPEPWAGDWLQERWDQMVNNENYVGYPGPLPKYWKVLGLDEMHPSVSFELQERVVRDSPYWYGTCNGWAAAAVLFDEPEAIVINGVKFMASDLKAILASIWKDNVEFVLGRYDEEGITAKGFEEVINEHLAQGQPLVFDITLGTESWNYPVIGFERRATDNGDFINVEVDMRYSNTVIMADLDRDFSHTRYLDLTYTYRYTKLFPRQYEWTGDSITSRPDRAWYSTVPLLPASWYSRANRYLDMGDYFELLAMAAADLNEMDIYEPNDDVTEASKIEERLTLASALPRETDVYLFPHANDTFELEVFVYDGPEMTVELLNSRMEVLQRHEKVKEAVLKPGDAFQGDLFVRITSEHDVENAYYRMVRNEGHSYLQADPRMLDGTAKAIAIRDSLKLEGDGFQTVLAALGSHQMQTTDQTISASERTYWAVTGNGDQPEKRYHLGHDLKMAYNVPHLTCRNGWKTALELYRTNADPVVIRVYNMDGTLLIEQELPNQTTMDLGQVLDDEAAAQGTWFTLNTSLENRLFGAVTYGHEGIDYHARYDIEARPRHTELFVHALPKAGEGWVGLALVNDNEVNTPVLWRLLDDDNDIVDEGLLDLAPQQKWLGLPSNLTQAEIGDRYTLVFFAHYPLESLALRQEVAGARDYAYRLPNKIHDHYQETYITPTFKGDWTQDWAFSNNNSGVNWVLFRAYDEAGQELGLYRLESRAMRPYETTYVGRDSLLAAFELADSSQISYIKVTAQRPLLIQELLGTEGSREKLVVYPVKVFDNP